jgi:lipopolysaccharide biosynthesis protein
MPNHVLSDLRPDPPGMARWRHGIAARSWLRYARRVAEVGTEIASSALLDRLRPLTGEVRRIESGIAPAGTGQLALYLHWSPDGRVSDMVLGQVASWRAAGFDVVFVSNAAPPPRDWDAVGAQAVLRIARDNVGRDFGGWRDAFAIAAARFGAPHDLLLANDSVLGPIRPLAPVLAALRSGGDGLFGLTESRGGGAHLQSYLLLARGAAAVAEVGRHLAACRPSRSKWRLVQQGELGLTRRMLRAGHRVAAVFGWDRVAAGLDAATLACFGPRFAEPGALDRYPLNPTHHLWRVLVERFGFPFLKTELVLRNPGRLPGVEAWRELVDAETCGLIEEHLRLMRGPR